MPPHMTRSSSKQTQLPQGKVARSGSFEVIEGWRGKVTIKSPEPKNVRFSTLSFREYPICVGDNPAVEGGAPLTIAWEYTEGIELPVEDYEKDRPEPRTLAELKIPRVERDLLLRRLGFTSSDIMVGTKAANIGRGQRLRTNETYQLQPLQGLVERVKRATLNATIRRGAKQKEREMMKLFPSPQCTRDTLRTLSMDSIIEPES